ncbi:hypothetical protein [Streptomyces sp. NBC_00140]|uniref:hypothetical protein n=1 Tax=Streptomyces sp. NBC_00140 TaxID=2975664 RepID=UPI00338F58A9
MEDVDHVFVFAVRLVAVDQEVLTALEKAAAEAEKTRSKGAASKNKTDRTPKRIPVGKSDDASGGGGNCG